jgi:catechol 2,3-dioxygenase-like lactoylglutathione lyase family enzyme
MPFSFPRGFMKIMRLKEGVVLAFLLAFGAAAAWGQKLPKQADAERGGSGVNMKIWVTSVMVNDQDKALEFYTDILGFVKKTDVPVGPDRWLTVVSPERPDGPELLLEPTGFPPAKTYQRALFEAGIPLTSFEVADIEAAHTRLKKLGVVFKTSPTRMGSVTVAVFEDTCGNLIQLMQK